MQLQEIAGSSSISVLAGEDYLQVLSYIHAALSPKTYLEVGSRSGVSLALATCASIAVDPEFNLTAGFLGIKPLCALYRMKSDQFFAETDVRGVFGKPVDFAFLDGLHLAEFLLRDFINTERHCKSNSIIALHDCIPVELPMTRRVETDTAAIAASQHPYWWTGDVWKVVVTLKKHRPDLQIHAFDASPTGLILITNLDSESRTLKKDYFKIAKEMNDLTLLSFGLKNYLSLIDVRQSSEITSREGISRYLWL